MNTEVEARLTGSNLRLGYEGHTVFDGIDVRIPDGKFTVIVGPNGCGKSTLLRTLCRLLKPKVGQVCLDGHDIHGLPTKALARQLGCCRKAPRRPMAFAWSIWWRAGVIRIRNCFANGVSTMNARCARPCR